MSQKWRYWLIALAVLAFLAALIVPAFQPAREAIRSHRRAHSQDQPVPEKPISD